MSIDKVLVENLDKQDALIDDMVIDIDGIIDTIKLKLAMKVPRVELINIAKDVKTIVVQKYSARALQNGLDLANDIQKEGKIEIENKRNVEDGTSKD